MSDLKKAEPGDRVTVKPAHVGALIPDPAHRNTIAQGGTEVVWDHYWIGRFTRGEIIAVEPPIADDAREIEPPTETHGA